MKLFPVGSEWRKWDLHVHLPSPRMSNNFESSAGQVDWDRFCSILEDSDVSAFGLTDYFNADSFFTFQEEFQGRYPDSEKAFFPVVELRLNEAVNKAREDVNFHILFRPDETKDRINGFLGSLVTELTDQQDRHLTCRDLTDKTLLESATVTRKAIEEAYSATFGKSPRTDWIMTIVPSNNDGIRADNANQRKRGLADQIDKSTDLVFGNGTNSEWFLHKDRFETGGGPSRPKPVVTGSDAHNFDDLLSWLGRSAPSPKEKSITWIKADLTYEGLRQTLIEPGSPVAIGDVKPDVKEPYRCIEKIVFEDGNFPTEVPFNPNLTSIIGSRSSGKSALLAYVAHAVDAEHTLDQQQAVSPKFKRSELGPAAGHSWASVEGIKRHIVWKNHDATNGQVIYVPQNSLYEISTRPEEITDKIRPALFRAYPVLERQFLEFEGAREASRIFMSTSIADGFTHISAVRQHSKDLAQLGDKAAILSTAQSIADEIAELRKSSSLTDAENDTHTAVTVELGEVAERLVDLNSQIDLLDEFVSVPAASDTSDSPQVFPSEKVTVSIETTPAAPTVSEEFGSAITDLVTRVTGELTEHLGQLLVVEHAKLTEERTTLVARTTELTATHAPLFAKISEVAATSDLEKRQATYRLTLANIEVEGKNIALRQAASEKSAEEIERNIFSRAERFKGLQDAFDAESRILDSMEFGIAFGTAVEDLEWLAQGFHKQAASEFLTDDRQSVEVDHVWEAPVKLLEALESGTQKIRQGEESKELAIRILTFSPTVRLTATLEGDQVGGFETPTMTPGKQALFALTLILSESDEPWPLLLDQPEDDLDSRSIYEIIVPYLTSRKKERQVIMVSHNANLVVGADSESVVVANRHGQDRKNHNGQRFDYMSGSLEHSEPAKSHSLILASRGISEHSCEILDGGSDAFEKRKNKYNIKWP
ncbi:TrlF family AAA-like ATPase [Glaciihabitans sp. UYNi722]|uniref:TrlF family AAA-like ATPase n=1 Tax=Glaciihabitans sp. UYNi722 TaxID=3156344 RepID=UPI0033923439